MTPDRLAVAEAVREHIEFVIGEDTETDLESIIEAIPEPEPDVQHHDAPTCGGWWWARFREDSGFVPGWHVIEIAKSNNGLIAAKVSGWIAAADAWVGPLLPPDTTKPAPDVQVVTFRTVELDDVAHRALRQAAQDVLDEAPTIQTPDVQAQIDADDGVCPRHGCAVCEECAIDAAVAREREEHPVLCDVLMIADEMAADIDCEKTPGGLEHMGDVREWFRDAAAEIRARSAKGV